MIIDHPFSASIAGLGVLAALMLVQVIVADVVGILRRHTPGTPVNPEHADALFRVTRTVANTNETIAIFICALAFCILTDASIEYTAYATWIYVGSRMVYAACYYANQQLMRSVSFGVSLLALAAMLIIGLTT